ncbi:hypothetical protein S1R3Y_000043 [Vibrio phage vB_ValP_VA-RY-3]|nr:hypothetical protein S1R3Y_000043 [Vibrio phage vB_ValP_VA-RY-3]
MPLMKLIEFAEKGLNSDIAPSLLDGNFVTYARNIRVKDGAIIPMGGHIELTELPANSNVGFIHYVPHNGAPYLILLGTDKIYHFDGTFIEVQPTPFVGASNPDLWSVSMLGQIPIITHPSTGPMFYNQSTGKYQSLPWDKAQDWNDASQTAKVVRAHKQFLIAMDVTDAGQEHPDAIRWSSPADIGSVPETWDPTDTTNFAGYTTLGGDGGYIIDGLSLRDSFVIYRQRSITILDYVRGSYVWKIRHMTESAGLLSKDCIAEANGVHYFIGDGDVYRNDGTNVRSIMHKRVKTSFATSIDKDNYHRSFARHNIAKSEIWFCVPQTGSSRPDIAYIYNYVDDTWAIRDLPNCLNATYGAPPAKSSVWDYIDSSWDDISRSWNDETQTPYSDSLITVIPSDDGTTGKIAILDTPIDSTSVPFSTIIERTDLAINGVNSVTTIKRIYPYITGVAKVMIQIGSQSRPGGPTSWKRAVEFDPNRDRKVDVRSTGELHCFRIYSDDVHAHFAFSGMDVEFIEAGER